MARKAKNSHLVEPTWGESECGGPPLTELTSQAAGPLSPFGEDVDPVRARIGELENEIEQLRKEVAALRAAREPRPKVKSA